MFQNVRAKSGENVVFEVCIILVGILVPLPVEGALGVLWCVESDLFKFSIDLKDKPVTRRGILSVTSSVYDPLGFLAPTIMPAKMLMQQPCKEGLAKFHHSFAEDGICGYKSYISCQS